TRTPPFGSEKGVRGRRMHTSLCAVAALFLFISCQQTGQVNPSGPSEEARVARIVSHCRELKPVELHVYLVGLADKKDFAALTASHQDGFNLSHWGVGEMARVMESKKVVAFCKSFPEGSEKWCAAFESLHYHPKREVLGFIKSMSVSPDPVIRYYCYRVC